MVLKTIYVARHGYRANWLPEPHPPNPTGVDSDPPLAPQGVKQAQELALFILSIEPKPGMIFSSPFYRCLETSTPIAEILDVPLEVEPGIGEWYKKNRPVVPKPASFDILKNFFPRLSNDWSSTTVPSIEGESEEDVFARCQEFITKFIPKFEQTHPQIETVLFVSHAATKIAFGMALLGFSSVHDVLDEDESRLRAGSCSLDQYDLGTDSRKWVLKMNGNCEFLSGGEEMAWNFQNGFEAGSTEDIKARQAAKEKQKEGSYQDFYVTLEIPPNSIGSIEKKFDTIPYTVNQQKKTSTTPSKGINSSLAKNSSINISEFNDISIPPTSVFQSSGLETKEPYVKINDSLYKGEWRKLIGTELIFDDNGDLIAKVKDHLKLKQGKLIGVNEDKTENVENVEDTSVNGKKVNLLSKALKLAKEVEESKKEASVPMDLD